MTPMMSSTIKTFLYLFGDFYEDDMASQRTVNILCVLPEAKSSKEAGEK